MRHNPGVQAGVYRGRRRGFGEFGNHGPGQATLPVLLLAFLLVLAMATAPDLCHFVGHATTHAAAAAYIRATSVIVQHIHQVLQVCTLFALAAWGTMFASRHTKSPVRHLGSILGLFMWYIMPLAFNVACVVTCIWTSGSKSVRLLHNCQRTEKRNR